MRQGDTFRGRNIATLTQATVAVPITKAVMEVRTKNKNVLVQRWASDDDVPLISITGTESNIVTLHPVDEATTEAWPTGVHVYGLTVWFEVDGAKKSILTGAFPVKDAVPTTLPPEAP